MTSPFLMCPHCHPSSSQAEEGVAEEAVLSEGGNAHHLSCHGECKTNVHTNTHTHTHTHTYGLPDPHEWLCGSKGEHHAGRWCWAFSIWRLAEWNWHRWVVMATLPLHHHHHHHCRRHHSRPSPLCLLRLGDSSQSESESYCICWYVCSVSRAAAVAAVRCDGSFGNSKSWITKIWINSVTLSVVWVVTSRWASNKESYWTVTLL